MLLVDPMAMRGTQWTILRMASPQVLIATAALMVVGQVWVRSRWLLGTRHTRSNYSSDAIHIYFPIQILPLLWETRGGPVRVRRFP